MELLRSPPPAAAAASSSARFINPSSSAPLFNLQSNFNPQPRISIFKHLKIYHVNATCRLKLKHLPPLSANAKASSPPPPPPTPPASRANNRKITIVACSAVTVALAIANRVLYKLALVPMKEFPFFLAQLTTFGYVFYLMSSLLFEYGLTDQRNSKQQTDDCFILTEALGVVSGMYSGAMLPGPAIPILNQTFLVWQLTFSILLLGRTYTLNRLVGCFLVAAGVVLAVT
ncbi:UNVERIFIED_CONTAM: protein CLT2, chloroplastic, partial [Sesamum latifolium]